MSSQRIAKFVFLEIRMAWLFSLDTKSPVQALMGNIYRYAGTKTNKQTVNKNNKQKYTNKQQNDNKDNIYSYVKR